MLLSGNSLMRSSRRETPAKPYRDFSLRPSPVGAHIMPWVLISCPLDSQRRFCLLLPCLLLTHLDVSLVIVFVSLLVQPKILLLLYLLHFLVLIRLLTLTLSLLLI